MDRSERRMGSPSIDARPAAPFDGIEVATLSADALRANVRVTGDLTPGTCALLTSVLRTHIGAGRRYLRVDLAAAHINGDAVVEALVAASRGTAELGGFLVFENAGPRVVDAMRAARLSVSPPTAART
jgi:anti-anti-sigma regulatory factor